MPLVQVRIWDSSGFRQLVANRQAPSIVVDGGGWAAPSELVDAVRRQVGVEVLLLRVVTRNLVEVEYVAKAEGGPPLGLLWRRQQMEPPARCRVPWGRPGWVAEMTREADLALARAGIARVGPPVQVRHTSVTGMLRVPTDHGPVWLKALPPVFSHEGPVISWLGELAVSSVPTVLADGPGWWLAAAFPKPSGSPRGDALLPLARIQIAAAPRVAELEASGCPRRLLRTLASDVLMIADRADLVQAEEGKRLRRSQATLEHTCERVESLGIPETVLHGDLSPYNVRWTGGRWLIYDWTDACIGHPFADLALPLSYERLESAAAARARFYASLWEGLVSPAALRRALRLAPVIGSAHQLANYVNIVDHMEPDAGDEASRAEMMVHLRFWLCRCLAALRAQGAAGRWETTWR